jgi:transcriptional regulator with XRE-family HTH domain
MENGSTRLKTLREIIGISQKEMAEKYGTHQRNWSRYENGTTDIPKNVLLSLAENGVNLHWIFTGTGEPFLNQNRDKLVSREEKNEQQEILSTRGVPFYDIDVAAHISEMFDGDVVPSFFVDFEPFNDCTAYLPIYGDSMFPHIQSGDIVAVKKLTNLDVILWGEAHLVITGPEANNLRTVKLVFQNEDPAKITLRASNPNFKGDTIVDKVAILSIYIVKGIITRKQW